MPPLFNNKDKIKVIEYGQHANDEISISDIKDFFAKVLNFKTAK